MNMAQEDPFEGAARRQEQLEAAGRRSVEGRMLAVWAGGSAIGIGLMGLAVDLSLDAVAYPMIVGGIVALVASLGARKAGVQASPLWHVGTVDGLHVQWAVLTGGAVKRRDLAGLAVATARYCQRYRWVPLFGLACALFLCGLLYSADRSWGDVVFGLPVLAIMTALVVTAVNAPKAEAANRALLDG